MPKVISLILGGGRGTRLFPLTKSRSKPAVPIAGKYRLIDIPISNCIHSGLNRIFVLTQFNSVSLHRHIYNTYKFDPYGGGFVEILAAQQTMEHESWYQGTADAVRRNIPYFTESTYDLVLILSGDQLYQMDFEDMIDQHIKANADISIATIPVHANDVPGFGILKTDENNMVTAFIEKPKSNFESWASEVSPQMQAEGRLYLASMGIYLFNRKLLYELLQGNERTDFGKEIIPESINEHRVLSYQYEGYWTDIGTIASFFDANLGLTDDIPQFNLFDKNISIFMKHIFCMPLVNMF